MPCHARLITEFLCACGLQDARVQAGSIDYADNNDRSLPTVLTSRWCSESAPSVGSEEERLA